MSVSNGKPTIEQAFRQSEARLRLMADTIDDVFWITDWNEHRTVFVSQAYERVWGLCAQDLYQNKTDWADAIHPEDRERAWNNFVQLEAGGRYDEEYRIIRPDGSLRWIRDRGFPVFKNGDEIDCVVGIAQDITEKKMAEEAIVREQQFTNAALDALVDTFFVFDPSTRRAVRWNRAFRDISGYTDEEIASRKVPDEWYDPENLEREREAVEGILRGGQDTVEIPLVTKDGTRVPTEYTASAIHDAEGRPRYIIAIGRDLAERRQAEQALRESEARFRALFDQSVDFIGLMRPDGTLILSNRTSLEFLGLTPEEVIGKPFWEGPWWTHSAELQETLRDAVRRAASGEFVRFEAFHPTPDGDIRYVDVSIKPVRNEAGEVYLLIPEGHDITDRKRAEEERRNLELQIQHAQKLESLGVLAGGIAHDFNNLLVAILGNADLALQDLPLHAPARERIHGIEVAARRAEGLARQMLAYSGRGRFVVEAIDIKEFVTETGHLLDVSLSKNVVLKHNFADDLPLFKGDVTQIRQIMMNLITNASESFGEKNGVIELTTGAMACDRTFLDSANLATQVGLDELLPEGTYVYFEVADKGCGMDEETLSRLFDPFFTTKFAGRGLGMAAVLGIVRGHKGVIKIHSEPKSGTTIRILFPATEEPAPKRAAAESPDTAAGSWRGTGVVLLADDEESVRAVASLMLQNIGFEVLTASDGREAVSVFQERAADIVCVLLDLTMPNMDGEEAFHELRRIRPDVNVVLCSGYGEQDATRRFAGKGLSGFIQKPYKTAEVAAELKKVIGTVPDQRS